MFIDFSEFKFVVDHYNADLGMHLHKIAEETGEVAEAWISANGIGKKAGEFDMDDVLGEIFDVAIASMSSAYKLDPENASYKFQMKLEQVRNKLKAVDENN